MNCFVRSAVIVSVCWVSCREADGNGQSASSETHWSFRAIDDPQAPPVDDESWVRTPLDRFVLARLEEHGLRPVAPASRRELIRRVFLDVLGFVPEPETVQSFLDDDSPQAWPRLVDRLLSSPHYGERWGRHWLDVARYADDQLRTEYYYRPLPHAWRYRDWVIQSWNEDRPYDEFVTDQLAGDLLGPGSTVATGFLALGMIYQDDGGTPESVAVAFAETLDDRVDTVTRGLLGLTVSCARCHDHKFDPIPIEEYYALAGVFQNAKYVEDAPLVAPEVVERYQAIQLEIGTIRGELANAEKAKDAKRITELRSQLAERQRTAPSVFPRAHAMVESGNADMRVALRGDRLNPGELVPRGFLRVIAGGEPTRFREGSGRLELARAIVSGKNPLTARVIVNRIWQHYFGRGIVATASNFGALGEPPTHPELLDWLASRLIRSGWSLKAVHRAILLSETYCLGTRSNTDNERIDGDNRWLWRMSRRRLDVEAMRDTLLSVTGELDRRMSGSPVSDLMTSHRRTVYGAARRDNQTESDELLRSFDFPNPRISSSGRTSTTTAQQQLFSLNSTFVIARARALARRTRDEPDRVAKAFAIVLGRRPSQQESQSAAAFLDGEDDSAEFSLWEQYCQVLLVSNEAMFRP